MILAHNYQLPEVQDVADYVGDSLGPLGQGRGHGGGRDRVLRRALHGRDGLDPVAGEDGAAARPRRRLLSLADSITADQLRAWKAKHPGAVVVMYVNTTAEVKAETDYCVTSSNAVAVVEHIHREHGAGTEILFGPDMFLGAYVEKVTGRKMHVWDGECHVHAGIRPPSDIADMRAAHPGADFLIHPECGCSTSVMEYVAAGDVAAEGVHMLSTGGMLDYARHAQPGTTAIMATEVGMLHPLRMAAPEVDFVAANEAASCRYMKMITLPKLRDALRDGRPVVKVPAESPSGRACRSSGWSRSRRSQRAAATRHVAGAGVAEIVRGASGGAESLCRRRPPSCLVDAIGDVGHDHVRRRRRCCRPPPLDRCPSETARRRPTSSGTPVERSGRARRCRPRSGA